MQGKNLISLTVPTYKEHDYIIDTLVNISQQTMFPDCEIVIADYDPDGTNETYNSIFSKGKLPQDVLERIEWVEVPRKGIGIARRMAVEASTSPFIMTFDADCKFGRHDSMELLMQPLIAGEALIVHCNNVLDINDKPTLFSDTLYAARNILNSMIPFAYEPGLTMSRATYDFIGGWPDVTMGEAPLLSIQAMLKLGKEVFKMVDEVSIICSARRLNQSILDINYEHAYRGKAMHEIK